mmetsp:Transcript_56946/g.178365  ORF Transcript_56946/g.178365 Transcript_56946/m.178365 type:complete len:344 (-) Transcript_56946:398-1429(-)
MYAAGHHPLSCAWSVDDPGGRQSLRPGSKPIPPNQHEHHHHDHDGNVQHNDYLDHHHHDYDQRDHHDHEHHHLLHHANWHHHDNHKHQHDHHRHHHDHQLNPHHDEHHERVEHHHQFHPHDPHDPHYRHHRHQHHDPAWAGCRLGGAPRLRGGQGAPPADAEARVARLPVDDRAERRLREAPGEPRPEGCLRGASLRGDRRGSRTRCRSRPRPAGPQAGLRCGQGDNSVAELGCGLRCGVPAQGVDQARPASGAERGRRPGHRRRLDRTDHSDGRQHHWPCAHGQRDPPQCGLAAALFHRPRGRWKLGAGGHCVPHLRVRPEVQGGLRARAWRGPASRTLWLG